MKICAYLTRRDINRKKVKTSKAVISESKHLSLCMRTFGVSSHTSNNLNFDFYRKILYTMKVIKIVP